MAAAGDWMLDAECTTEDPELFFPIGTSGVLYEAQVEEARAVCRRCPVTAECVIYAIKSGQKYGIWGGLDELELERARDRYLRAERRRNRALSGLRAGNAAQVASAIERATAWAEALREGVPIERIAEDARVKVPSVQRALRRYKFDPATGMSLGT